eukprot:g35739.t1
MLPLTYYRSPPDTYDRTVYYNYYRIIALPLMLTTVPSTITIIALPLTLTTVPSYDYVYISPPEINKNNI